MTAGNSSDDSPLYDCDLFQLCINTGELIDHRPEESEAIMAMSRNAIEQRKHERKERNRRAAERSRHRKNDMIQRLSARCAELEAEKTRLEAEIARLQGFLHDHGWT